MSSLDTKVLLGYIPHGVNPTKFYKITEPSELEALNTTRKQLLGPHFDSAEFVVLYNSRNIRRKMTSDVILAFNKFFQMLSEDDKKKCVLVLHTQPIDDHGTDLPMVINDVTPGIPVIFSQHRIDGSTMNHLYNIADVTINLASNEGFGLSTCESLMAETPIIANVTGGLQDQMGFRDDDGNLLDPNVHFDSLWGSNHDGRYSVCGPWVIPVFPATISLQGSPVTPYIFDDRCSWIEAANAIYRMWSFGKEDREVRGRLGREYCLGEGELNSENMSRLFISGINYAIKQFTPRKKFTLDKV